MTNNTIINQGNDILSAIISTCLWNEPHQLLEILVALEKIFSVDDESRDEFLMSTSFVLGEAIKTGLIKKKLGFYALTTQGRKKVEDDLRSLFNTTFNSLPDY